METSATEEGKTPLNQKGLPEKLASLRSKLYHKAKNEPRFRFYVLYDRIFRIDVLESAYSRVKSNGGSPGIDGITFKEIEKGEGGIGKFLQSIQDELKRKSYKPRPVRRVYIPKADGKLRPLGIPTIKDRVVQMATLLILEPIFEADFLDCSYGFRPGRSAHDALAEIKGHIQSGLQAVYDADLKGYFDSIPHDKLMRCVEQRISDRSVLNLIRMWLGTPVVEPPDDKGNPSRIVKSKQGTPQGGVISPLLANLFLHYFDKVFHGKNGPAIWANAKLVRYADDYLVLARYQSDRLINFVEGFIEGRMGLVVNRNKTKVVDLKKPRSSLDFLGFTFRYDRDLRGRKREYLNVTPSRRSIQRMRDKLKGMTGKEMCFQPIDEMIHDINRTLIGWSNYFRFGYPAVPFRKINSYAVLRLTKHLRRRSQRGFRPPEGVSYYSQIYKFGLVYLK